MSLSWTPDEEQRLREMIAADWPIAEMVVALGRPKNAVRQKRDRLRAGVATFPTAPSVADVVDAPPDAATVIESEPSPRILTLDELLDKSKVDRTVWAVERFVVNKWEVGAKDAKGKIVVEPLYQVKAWLVRRAPESLVALKESLIADIKQDAAHFPRYRLKAVVHQAPSGEQYMAEVETPDAHIGKMAWGEETGTDYDSGIAESLVRAHVAELLWHCERYPIEQFVLPVGNDLLHHELSGATTAGTPQDADTRWLKMFRRARGVISWQIRILAERAPVVVIIVPGNHARQGEMALGEVLAAEFAHDTRVTFDASPAPRKYHRYGKNLLGLAHGDGEPHAKYPQLMAVEEPGLWARTTHREFHIGHLHTARRTEPMTVDDKLGVTVRIMRSLSGVDAWHKAKGYLGTRGAEAFIWKKSGGIVANFMTYVPPAREAA